MNDDDADRLRRRAEIRAMPTPQLHGVARVLRRYRRAGIEATWHPNRCGCCVSVHENVEHPRGGYVINRDGDGANEWLEVVE